METMNKWTARPTIIEPGISPLLFEMIYFHRYILFFSSEGKSSTRLLNKKIKNARNQRIVESARIFRSRFLYFITLENVSFFTSFRKTSLELESLNILFLDLEVIHYFCDYSLVIFFLSSPSQRTRSQRSQKKRKKNVFINA